ncbi:MAG TPA: thiamine-monophosphate kinase, partial [Verrucomicrobiae bacterium]|nr:thiamine-monophosphate kinase [Verrucomicrobiae bacterium]
ILQRSNVGAEILGSAIPISRAAKLQGKAESSAKTPLLAALTDGEDFELLFTVPAKSAIPLLDAWKKQFPNLRLSCIGKIAASPGLKLRDKTGVRSLEAHGYVHFA